MCKEIFRTLRKAAKILAYVGIVMGYVLFNVSLSVAQMSAFPTELESSLSPDECACETVTLHCATATELAMKCGANTYACATNDLTGTEHEDMSCEIWMWEGHCEILGLENQVGENQVNDLFPGNCTDFITGEAEDPEDELAAAYLCCILRHELVHATDPLCFRDTTVECSEATAYSDTETCRQDIAIAVAEAYPAEEEIRVNTCELILERSVQQRANECLCNVQTDNQNGQTNPVSREDREDCLRYCIDNVGPDEFPAECENDVDRRESSDDDSDILTFIDVYLEPACRIVLGLPIPAENFHQSM